jgi:hypothetical protein
MTTTYPLQWPDGWPRTPEHHIQDGRSRFARGRDRKTYNRIYWTFSEARDRLTKELEQLGAKQIVVSSNFKLNRYQVASASETGKRPDDQGIAVYFLLNGEQLAMARDAFSRAEENMRSLTLAVEAMRQLDRHGGSTMMRRAFQGFAALAPPKTCWQILGFKNPEKNVANIQQRFRERAMETHPDKGGEAIDMAALVKARDEAIAWAES